MPSETAAAPAVRHLASSGTPEPVPLPLALAIFLGQLGVATAFVRAAETRAPSWVLVALGALFYVIGLASPGLRRNVGAYAWVLFVPVGPILALGGVAGSLFLAKDRPLAQRIGGALVGLGAGLTWPIALLWAWSVNEPPGEIASSSDLSVVGSVYVALGAAVALPSSWIAGFSMEWRRQAELLRGAEAALEGASRPARPGQDCVVAGTVELAADADVAMRVEIDQAGSERESSGSWSWSWKETGRRVIVRPFYLRSASGRIRVEPDEQTRLLDSLDGRIFVNATRRTAVAELVPGERVTIAGRLERGNDPEQPGGYRGGAGGMVLRGTGEMRLLISSHDIRDPFRRGAALARMGLAGALVALLVSLGLSLGYHVLSWGGVEDVATITGKRVDERDYEDSTSRVPVLDYTVRALGGGAGEVRGSWDVSSATYDRVAIGDQVPVLRAWDIVRLGTAPRLDMFMGILLLIVNGILAPMAYWAASRARRNVNRDWHELAKVEHSGSGRLRDHLRS